MSVVIRDQSAAYKQWLNELLISHAALQSNNVLRDFLQNFLDQIQQFHQQNDSPILYCRGQHRALISENEVPPTNSQKRQSSTIFYAQWFEFVQLSAQSRKSGPTYQGNKRRFEVLSMKVQASRDRSKFGITDDTGYLFPCLQYYVPRACFFVMDHVHQQVFIIHGSKKFGGQGDDGAEEGSTDLHSRATAKCFPHTQLLPPTHYIFTWKANGKNAGVIGYLDPLSNEIWLFVNSKGVCECAGLLDDIMKDPSIPTWSEEIDGTFLPGILECFCHIWHHSSVNQERIKSLWREGYSILFELCDNMHICLEQGPGGRPVNHLAFIGLVKQPTAASYNTYESGLIYRYNNTFTFDFWKNQVQAPAYSCKPTMHVKLEDLEQATRQLMQGTLFRHCSTSLHGETTVWYDPNEDVQKEAAMLGEGAVCYEMAKAEDGSHVIRQLFKAKTASYITHRQFRGFLSKIKQDDPVCFEEFYQRVKRFCRQKFGDLVENPYPDVKSFCDAPSDAVVQTAALFYAHFGMWLQQMASNLQTTVAALVGVTNSDVLIPLDSKVGQDYRKTATLMGLYDEDIFFKKTSPEDDQLIVSKKAMIAIRCGFAFRIQEFSCLFGLDHSKVFSAPALLFEELRTLERTSPPVFQWKNMPTGHNGFIMIGFNLAFPEGVEPNNDNSEETKKQRKKAKKKRKKKHDRSCVLDAFRNAFRSFLLANPDVKLTVGPRQENPELILYTSLSQNEILIASANIKEFYESLAKLSSVEQPESSSNQRLGFRVLPEELAVAQATSTLQSAFTGLQALFEDKAVLNFGDVHGRLIPLQKSVTDGNEGNKNMLIIRGFPGLGKSTVATAFQAIFSEAHVAIIEADQYFGPHCPFNPDLLPTAHQDAQYRAEEAMKDPNIHLVIVSNTSTTTREYGAYVRITCNMKNSQIAILTLDTEIAPDKIENVHAVPQEKVKQMAFRLRHPDNEPEGKTIHEILEIAEKQAVNYRTIPGPALVWTLIGEDGLSVLNEIWCSFTKFAAEHSIVIPSNILRPSNAHVTQLFLRSSSPRQDVQQLAEAWDHHGHEQTVTIGEVRYCVRCGDENETGKTSSVFLNLAVEVLQFSPRITDTELPHITIAYNPDYMSPVDSVKLWKDNDADVEEVKMKHRKSTFGYQPSCKQFSGQIQTGVFQSNQIFHQWPKWAVVS